MEGDCQSDDHGRNPLQLFQRSACHRQRRRSVRLRHLRRVLPAHRCLLSSPIRRFRSASRHRLGAWRHGSARGRRHLPHGWPGRRPEPSDLEYRRPLLLQQHVISHAFLSPDSVSSVRGSRRAGSGFSARSGSQPERRLRGGMDRVSAAETAFEHPGNRQLSRQQGNACSDHDLRQPGESADRRCAVPGVRSGFLARRRRQQHLPCAAIQRPPSLSERLPALGELHVVAFDQRRQHRRRRIRHAAGFLLPIVR